jgi:hypothetical protein
MPQARDLIEGNGSLQMKQLAGLPWRSCGRLVRACYAAFFRFQVKAAADSSGCNSNGDDVRGLVYGELPDVVKFFLWTIPQLEREVMAAEDGFDFWPQLERLAGEVEG